MTSKPPAETDPPGGPAPRDGEALRTPVETPYAQTSPPAEADPPPVAGATADSYAFAAPMLVLLFLTGTRAAVSRPIDWVTGGL